MDSEEKPIVMPNPKNNVEVLEFRLERIEDGIKQIIRRLDSQEKTLDLIYHERDLLEDTQVAVKSLKEALNLHRETQANSNKELKNQVSEVKEGIDNTPDEVEKVVSKRFEDLTHVIEKTKQVVLIKPGFFGKLKLLVTKRGKQGSGGDLIERKTSN